MFKDTRKLFKTPDVIPASELTPKWGTPDEKGLVAYMRGKKGFNETLIRSGFKKLLKLSRKGTFHEVSNYKLGSIGLVYEVKFHGPT